jgi:uncharacterized zinc-type alcohol dehydrogenase-like protein
MHEVHAYAAFSATDPLGPLTISRREVGPHDLLIEIHYCGICHSDIHHVRGEWGGVAYPVAPGHEIAGVVAAVGDEVTRYAVGDRVGVGCMVDSCRTCPSCRKGEEQYCHHGATMTYGSVDRYGELTHGGYSTHLVVSEDFAVRIPDGLDLSVAAPILCAGITTYSPLRHWGAGPGKKVAIVGMGGLGHMAVQLAHAMGAEVTVLSQTLNKMQDGLSLGADHYHATSDPETFRKLANTFDLILNTVSARLNLNAYLSLLAVDGTLVNLGAPSEPLAVQVFSLLLKRRSFAGSLIGGIRETQEVLDFCAEHGITPRIELIPAQKINEAFERVLASDVRYRFVIDISTLKE